MSTPIVLITVLRWGRQTLYPINTIVFRQASMTLCQSKRLNRFDRLSSTGDCQPSPSSRLAFLLTVFPDVAAEDRVEQMSGHRGHI